MLNKSMAMKRQEDKFYAKLEEQFNKLKLEETHLVKKPSRE